MANLGGIIAGAIGGGAQAVGQMAQDTLDRNSKLDLAQQLGAMDEERAKRIAEHSANLGLKTRQTEREQQLDFDTSEGTVQKRLGAAKATAEGALAIDESLAPRKRALATEDAKAAEKGRREATVESGMDKDYLRALRNIAVATKPPESAASLAQAALAQFELDQKKGLLEDQVALAAALQKGDTAAVEALRTKISARVGGGEMLKPSDRVKVAEAYQGLAKSKRAQLTSVDFMQLPADQQASERKQIEADANAYELAAAQSLAAAVGKAANGSAAPSSAASGTDALLDKFGFPSAASKGAQKGPTKDSAAASATPAPPAVKAPLFKPGVYDAVNATRDAASAGVNAVGDALFRKPPP